MAVSSSTLYRLAGVFLIASALSCEKKSSPSFELTDLERRWPRYALSEAVNYPGTTASLFASEGWLVNPTNIAVDARGRVWVCEAVNYREHANPQNPRRKGGDRILILEDTNGDGYVDKQTVYYQGEDLVSPLGIIVLGNQVIVSCSPNAWIFTDDDGDDQPDRKEALFTGIGGSDNDHGLHAFVFGPDGRLYFNFGNAGSQLLTPNGKPVLDLLGQPVAASGKPYRQGMAFRCELDGSNLEVIGHNFRNNYELAVNSFGEIFQTDNDDDGNFGARVNFLLEYGNYGYTDASTGAGWREYRLNMEQESAPRHWRQNDPGVVPNLLHTGSGSPAGLCIYEGDMLPAVFKGQMIHAEPAHHVVRSYPLAPAGAGFDAWMENLLQHKKDDWFRPVDVAVAPDGCLIVADWHDPGVGGHHAADIARGRIIRIAAPNARYRTPTIDTSTLEGAARALINPNMDARYLAWMRLHRAGVDAEPVLRALLARPDAQTQAQALWLLAGIPEKTDAYLRFALSHTEPEIRALGLRVARRWAPTQITTYAAIAAQDSHPAVRREAAIALRYAKGKEADQIWASLANQYTPGDRWALEALGIGADLYPADRWKAWRAATPIDLSRETHQELIWRMRSPEAAPLLAQLARHAPGFESERFLRAFAFHPSEVAAPLIASLVADTSWSLEGRIAALSLLDANTALRIPGGQAALANLLAASRGAHAYIHSVDRLQVSKEYPHLLLIASTAADLETRVNALRPLLRNGEITGISTALRQGDEAIQQRILSALGKIGNFQACNLIIQTLDDPAFSLSARTAAVDALGMDWEGEHRLSYMLTSGKLAEPLRRPAAMRLLTAIDPGVQKSGKAWLAATTDRARTSAMPALAGNPDRGAVAFQTYCSQCHRIGSQGVPFGPDLSAISAKLGRAGIYQAIARPNDGINFGYEGITVTLKDGAILSGYYVSKTDLTGTLMTMGGITRKFSFSDVLEEKPLSHSLMPSGLDLVMSEQELADLLAWLETQKSGALAVHP